MSVNVVGRRARSSGTLVERVTQVPRRGAGRSGLPDPRGHRERRARRICTARSPTFDALQRAGVHVAIDNVGTGYTSLAYLRRLPIDILKIARPLVAELGDPNSSGELARDRRPPRRGAPPRARRRGRRDCRSRSSASTSSAARMAQGFHLARPCDVERHGGAARQGGLDPAQFMRTAPLARSVPRNEGSLGRGAYPHRVQQRETLRELAVAAAAAAAALGRPGARRLRAR